MTDFSDLTALIAGLICVQTLWQLSQNWSKFWDDPVTPEDQQLAQRLAIFALVPIGVLLHEIGHCLATWQVGGTVIAFQWRFYWGYIIPSGSFSPVEQWWIAFSGNLVSILLGLVAIPFIPLVRKRIVGELLYFFALVELIYALIGYPLLSLSIRGGDWVQIYNFDVQPYATITLIGHVGLLWGLWQLYHSRRAIRWRLDRNASTLDEWEMLEANAAEHPNQLQPQLELAYFLIQHSEMREARQVSRKIYRLAPEDERVKIFQVAMLSSRRAYRKAIQAGQNLLNSNPSAEAQIRIYRILCHSAYSSNQLKAALSYANRGLAISPKDYKLRYHSAIAHWMSKLPQKAKADFDIALENAPDEEIRQQIQQWLGQHFKRY
ncbi:M50 family metallopeptidase [Romeria aff. gracilis LEGE 07310]|uniref:M50 family metallopeptidase n=1 Tax=Vasconcelosia minhoensis LEGE 07310 TaxID=915328 RepID=A0A8J7DRC0_9CYAN|nr:M50 family metallopeptidase [Romeria gracilis]MBE9078199.1 M50 family metallopeptidase [Romeria aff. gracilis LEGE 07310]